MHSHQKKKKKKKKKGRKKEEDVQRGGTNHKRQHSRHFYRSKRGLEINYLDLLAGFGSGVLFRG
jgi:hypothetical protein